MQNLELIKQAAFQRGFQKRAFPLSAATAASKVLPNIVRAGAKMQPFNIARQAAQAASGMQPFNIARRAAQQVGAGAGRTVGRPLAPYQGFSFAHNGVNPYRGFNFAHNGRQALANAPWWKMGLGQGGGVRNVFGQGMSSPYIKYPVLAALAGGAGYGIDHMASGGMTPDGYKANWGMFSGGPPEMMPPPQIPSREWFNENQMYG